MHSCKVPAWADQRSVETAVSFTSASPLLRPLRKNAQGVRCRTLSMETLRKTSHTDFSVDIRQQVPETDRGVCWRCDLNLPPKSLNPGATLQKARSRLHHCHHRHPASVTPVPGALGILWVLDWWTWTLHLVSQSLNLNSFLKEFPKRVS